MNGLSTRFPNGVVNRTAQHPFFNLIVPDLLTLQYERQDFNQYVAADWTVTETQAAATQALTAGAGGLILLTNSGANNDVNQIQKNPANFAFTSGKRAWVGARFQLSDATNSAFAVGLQNVSADGTVLSNATDGLFFLKPTAAAALVGYFRQDNSTGSANSATLATLADATSVTVEAYWDGKTSVIFGVNGVVVDQIDVTSSMIPNANLALVACVKNGAVAAKTATIDYLFAAVER